jgi:hypothetical protein
MTPLSYISFVMWFFVHLLLLLRQVRLKLRTQLTGLRPVEVVLPRRGSGAMSATTSRLVRCGGSRGPAPALNELPASSADAEAALQVRGWC